MSKPCQVQTHCFGWKVVKEKECVSTQVCFNYKEGFLLLIVNLTIRAVHVGKGII